MINHFLAGACLALTLFPLTVSAQCSGVPECGPSSGSARVLQSAAVNMGLGGISGGTLAAIRGGSFLRGFVQGAAGGGLTHLGKTIAVRRWEGAGLVGRGVASIGSSVSMNAAERRGPVDLVAVPVGPVRLYLAPGQRVRARVDASALIAVASFAAESNARVDWGASLSDGTVVFRRPNSDDVPRGWHRAGVIGYRGADEPDSYDVVAAEEARAHERVHMIQHDQTFLLLGRPIEDALMPRSRWVDLGVNSLLVSVGNHLIDHESRPWEREAYLLTERSQPEGGFVQWSR